MANPWFRLWGDMVNDPKWRTIARKSNQSIGNVIAVALHMMTLASTASQRGCIEGWSDEDIGTALDIDTEQVQAIRDAMQGRVLDGERLTGWEKRQPIKEDSNAAERAREFRERAKAEAEAERLRTLPNAPERQVTLEEIREDTDEIREELNLPLEKRVEAKKEKSQRGSRLPPNWIAGESDKNFCESERPDLDVNAMQAKFRDYWHGVAGSKGCKLDWPATWRNFIRSERRAPQSFKPFESERDRKRREVVEVLTGKKNDYANIIDI